ncbi:MAG: tetratricopeptide repeat protein [Spirochaeta sp.]|nr:tetratricopeptide repeat protein [Spirochaeta sp.]
MDFTRSINRKLIIAFLTAALALFLISCRSATDTLEPDLLPAEIFQRAQEAADSSRYNQALLYYQTFQERYPEEVERNLWASYEIAFLYYKLGEYDRAVELFDELIELYNTEESATMIPAPKILSLKVKAIILDKQKDTTAAE